MSQIDGQTMFSALRSKTCSSSLQRTDPIDLISLHAGYLVHGRMAGDSIMIDVGYISGYWEHMGTIWYRAIYHVCSVLFWFFLCNGLLSAFK